VQLGRIYQAIRQHGGSMLITADHGNAELLIDPLTGGPHTAHTTNPVPFILVSDEKNIGLREGGSLRDLSPTLLSMMKIDQPGQMTGGNLRMPSRE
jgi:2,3-bisphosphoglycerate-independent phosphoglycerate mutase